MSKLTNRLGRLRQLRRPADALLLVRVVAVAAMVPVVTRLPLPRQAAVLRWRGRRNRRSPDAESLVGVVELAQHVASPLVRRGCLTRCITLYWFLGRADDDIELCFGVGYPDGRFGAHSWLAKGGQPFLERVDPTLSFAVIYRIPSAPGPAAPNVSPRCQ